MKLEFHGDLASIYVPFEEKDKVIAFLEKYKINYKEIEIKRIEKIYIQFSFYASDTIFRLFNQFKEEIQLS